LQTLDISVKKWEKAKDGVKAKEKGKARLRPGNGKMDCADVSTAAETVCAATFVIVVFKWKTQEDSGKASVFIACWVASCLAFQPFFNVLRFVSSIKLKEAFAGMSPPPVAVHVVPPSRLLMSLIIMESNS